MIKITDNKGIQLTFGNGVTISIQFGSGNYCDNRMNYGGNNSQCNNAEVAIWNKEGEFITKEICTANDDVMGYLSPDIITELIYRAKNYKK